MLHSNEREFTRQFNGLYPSIDNWYADSVRVFDGARPIRLLVGPKARLFTDAASMLLDYNLVRHRIVADALVGGLASILDEEHSHHYFMPSSSSAAIGCYVCHPHEHVPVFSTFSEPIAIFEALPGGRNVASRHDGDDRLVVPHGWGMTITCPLTVTLTDSRLHVNARAFDTRAGESLFAHPDVVPRTFAGGVGQFAQDIQDHTPGRIVEVLDQLVSYSRVGYAIHVPRSLA